MPRSLTLLQEQHLIRQLLSHYKVRGSYMALALMLYLGLRPSECLGLTFGDIHPLEGYSGIRCLYVYKQRKEDRAVTNRLKTRNAYRILPIPSELDDLLRQREKGMRTQLTGDLSAYPMERRVLYRALSKDQTRLVLNQPEGVVTGYSLLQAKVVQACFAAPDDVVVLDVWADVAGNHIAVARDLAVSEVAVDYEPMPSQSAGRLDVAQTYRDAVRRVRNRSRTLSRKQDKDQ